MYLWVVLWVQRVVYLLCITGYVTVSVSTDYGWCINICMTVEDTLI